VQPESSQGDVGVWLEASALDLTAVKVLVLADVVRRARGLPAVLGRGVPEAWARAVGAVVQEAPVVVPEPARLRRGRVAQAVCVGEARDLSAPEVVVDERKLLPSLHVWLPVVHGLEGLVGARRVSLVGWTSTPWALADVAGVQVPVDGEFVVYALSDGEAVVVAREALVDFLTAWAPEHLSVREVKLGGERVQTAHLAQVTRLLTYLSGEELLACRVTHPLLEGALAVTGGGTLHETGVSFAAGSLGQVEQPVVVTGIEATDAAVLAALAARGTRFQVADELQPASSPRCRHCWGEVRYRAVWQWGMEVQSGWGSLEGEGALAPVTRCAACDEEVWGAEATPCARCGGVREVRQVSFSWPSAPVEVLVTARAQVTQACRERLVVGVVTGASPSLEGRSPEVLRWWAIATPWAEPETWEASRFDEAADALLRLRTRLNQLVDLVAATPSTDSSGPLQTRAAAVMSEETPFDQRGPQVLDFLESEPLPDAPTPADRAAWRAVLSLVLSWLEPITCDTVAQTRTRLGR
jgi:hypothetical protein